MLSRLHKGEISVISSLAKELPFLPQFLGLLQGLAKENNTHTQEEMSLGYFFQHGCGKRKKGKKKNSQVQVEALRFAPGAPDASMEGSSWIPPISPSPLQNEVTEQFALET